jgi:lysozyme
MAKLKTKLSAAMLALIAAGASAPVLMDQFQDEKEGTSLIAYPYRGGVWTICGGVTYVNGKRIKRPGGDRTKRQLLRGVSR